MKFIDFFSGVGGFRRGMELAGHECVGFCEFDKFAVAGYTVMHLMTEQEREYISTLPKNKGWQKQERRNTDMENGMQMTLDGFSPRTYRKQTAGVSDSPVRTSALPESSLALTEQEAACFSELCALCKTSKKKIDPHTYSLRTLKTYLALMGERTSLNFSLKWTKVGTMQNGKLSTLPITSRKTGKEFSLSDILEGEVPQKYFLSKEQTEKIVFK